MAKKGSHNGKGSAGQNKKAGIEFLKKNLQRPDVVELESGLQYQIIKEAEGPKPTANSRVKVNQRALLVGGVVIDDTYRDGLPSEFALDEVIDGYQEGLQMMSVGSRYKFFVPEYLAWGKKGSTTKIGPYSTVIFDVTLLEILD